MTTNNAGKNSQDAGYLAMFQNFLVNKSDSPPPGYFSESDDDLRTTAPMPHSDGDQSEGTVIKEQASGSDKEIKKARPIEVVKPFVSELEESSLVPIIESVTSLGTKKKKKKKGKGKKIVTKKDVPTPLRTSARRKAKEATNSKVTEFLEEEDTLEDLESDFDLGDSDADPAWSPLKENSDDDGPRRRGGRRKRRVSTPSITSDSDDEPLAKQLKTTTKVSPKNDQKRDQKITEHVIVKPKEDALSTKVAQPTKSTNVSCEGNLPSALSPIGGDYKPGEFVVLKEDLDKEYPPIWRLDGKTLLQKYEPFKKDDEMLYRNLTTFSGWTSLSRPRYLRAPIKFRVQNRKEIIVEFLQDDLQLDDEDFADEKSKDFENVQENLEVYIQTLISQALDSNFLPEIYREKDDYFLPNLKTIDDMANKRKSYLETLSHWKEAPLKAVGTWPYFKIMPNETGFKDKVCAACETTPASSQMDLDGEPYNQETLEPYPTNAELDQNLFLCKVCSDRLQLYHKITHQKYLSFVECAKQVFVKKGNAVQNSTTNILSEMLADETWVKQVISSILDPLKAIDKLDTFKLRKIVAKKYQLNKPTMI